MITSTPPHLLDCMGNGRKTKAYRGLRDRGVFYIYSNEEKIGAIEFDLSPDGSYRGRTTVAVACQRTRYTLDVDTDGSRNWKKVGGSTGPSVVQGRAQPSLRNFPRRPPQPPS